MERSWERLIAALDAWSAARQIAPGRLEVVLPLAGDERRVQVVMTPAQWDEMASVVFGGVDDAIGYVTRVLAGLDGSQGFLVYTVYDVEPSSTPWVEEDPEVERLDRLARERFEGIGVWSPYPASGEVRDLPGD